MAIGNGKDYLFYLNLASEPATPDEITNYTKVAYLQNLEFSDSSERLQSNNKDNGSRGTSLPGNQSYGVTGTMEWDKAADAGQELILDAVQTTTTANKLLYYLISDNVTGNTQFRGSFYASNFTLPFNNNEIMVNSFEFAGNGAYIKEAVDA